MKHLPDENRRDNRPATVLMVLFVCVWLLFFAMDQEGTAVETSAALAGTESQESLSDEAGDEDGFFSVGTGNSGGSSGDVAENPDSSSGSGTGNSGGSSGRGKASGESSAGDAENRDGSELTADASGRLPSYLGASLFDGSREWTKELQADRDRLLQAQLGDDFRIPMRLGDGFGKLPVWKGSYDCGTLLFPWGKLTGDWKRTSGANTGRTEENRENSEEPGASEKDLEESGAPEKDSEESWASEKDSEEIETSEKDSEEPGASEKDSEEPGASEIDTEQGTTEAEETEAQDLEQTVSEAIAGYDGVWSVYFKNLKTGESFVINDQPMKSASVMKLFIMGTVYTAIEKGELERTDEIMALMQKMISNSDNASSNQLLYILGNASYADGIARVDAFIEEYGFSDMTVEYNGFDNPDTVIRNDSYNQVAAKDCGKLLEDIYRRTWVSRSVGNEIEEMLLAQTTRYKIPAGLPDGVLCGNKSGEMSSTENDAAIIYSDNCDYILVVLSSDWSSKDTAISRIAAVSSLVYEYLNP